MDYQYYKEKHSIEIEGLLKQLELLKKNKPANYKARIEKVLRMIEYLKDY